VTIITIIDMDMVTDMVMDMVMDIIDMAMAIVIIERI